MSMESEKRRHRRATLMSFDPLPKGNGFKRDLPWYLSKCHSQKMDERTQLSRSLLNTYWIKVNENWDSRVKAEVIYRPRRPKKDKLKKVTSTIDFLFDESNENTLEPKSVLPPIPQQKAMTLYTQKPKKLTRKEIIAQRLQELDNLVQKQPSKVDVSHVRRDVRKSICAAIPDRTEVDSNADSDEEPFLITERGEEFKQFSKKLHLNTIELSNAEKYRKDALVVSINDNDLDIELDESKRLTLEHMEYLKLASEMSTYLNTFGGEEKIESGDIAKEFFAISLETKGSVSKLKKMHAIELTNPPRTLVYFNPNGPKTLEDIEEEERKCSSYTGLPVHVNTQRENNFPRLTTTQMLSPKPYEPRPEYGKWYIPPSKWKLKIPSEHNSIEMMWKEINESNASSAIHDELERQNTTLSKLIHKMYGAKLFKEYLDTKGIRCPLFLKNVKYPPEFLNRHGASYSSRSSSRKNSLSSTGSSRRGSANVARRDREISTDIVVSESNGDLRRSSSIDTVRSFSDLTQVSQNINKSLSTLRANKSVSNLSRTSE
eukprot:Nk52_evm9s2209 gene=Nk52_evmTU9s2209